MSRSFRRRPAARALGRKVIIACEGSKTERGYFEGIRQALRLPAVRVLVVPHSGSDPRSVVRAAIRERDLQKRAESWMEGDCSWAVFDGDEHMAANPHNWNDAVQTARSNDISLAVSNPCFEFWYLLHFQEQFAHVTRDRACQLLKKHLPEYDKASRLYPVPLAPLTPEAIDRARRLEARNERNMLPLYPNPGTGVARLVEILLDLDKELG